LRLTKKLRETGLCLPVQFKVRVPQSICSAVTSILRVALRARHALQFRHRAADQEWLGAKHSGGIPIVAARQQPAASKLGSFAPRTVIADVASEIQ
jgi:hypothetical protein